MEGLKLVKKPRKRRLPKRAGPPKRGFRMNYKHVAIILGCAVVLSVGGYLLLISSPTFIKVGESMTYGIYIGGTKVGSLTSQITGTAPIEGVECYVAQYSLSTGSAARSGVLKFDKDGNLMRAAIAAAENLSLKWRTEVGYSFTDNLMRVVFEDNRTPENYRENDVYMNLTAEIMVPEHVWYLLRFGPLHQYYRREFYINLLPDATLNVRAAFQVVGDEVVETQAGRFDCWVLEGENTQPTSWPIDKLWVAKSERVVVKAIEWLGDVQVEYILESYE